MPRPTKCRRICAMPPMREFGPVPSRQACGSIVLSVDEYEVIRLIDWLGMNQEECAVQMEVARTTVQAIYTSARRKLADALVNGHQLKIEGGNYRVCPHQPCCFCESGSGTWQASGCGKAFCRKKKQEDGGLHHENCSDV